MPQKSWAVGEEVLAADFQTYLQNQVTAVFTSAAQRDSQWPAPPNGAVCVTTDTGTFWERVGGTWYTPFRRLGYSQRTTSGPSASAESIVLTTPAVVVPSGRLIRVDAGFRNVNAGAGEAAILRIREGTVTTGTQLVDTIANAMPTGLQAGTASGGMLSALYTPAVGTKQWILTSASVSATAVQITAGAVNPIWISVVDEGAA